MARLSKILRRRLGLSPALPSVASPSRSLKLKGDKNKKGKQCRYCGLLSSPPLIASVTSAIMAAGTIALFVAPPLLQIFRSAGIQEYDAVIVGAGWAGISAADTLLKGGVENILVVEAADVIGGRYVFVCELAHAHFIIVCTFNHLLLYASTLSLSLSPFVYI